MVLLFYKGGGVGGVREQRDALIVTFGSCWW